MNCIQGSHALTFRHNGPADLAYCMRCDRYLAAEQLGTVSLDLIEDYIMVFNERLQRARPWCSE